MNETPEALHSLMAIHLVYKEYDEAAYSLKQQLRVEICQRCGKCCQENTPFAYGVEAANVVSHMIGKGLMSKLQRRIEGWLLDRYECCPTYEPLVLNKVTFGLDDKIRDEALALSHTPCPFFENKSCLIYEARPLVCRALGVTRVEAACQRKSGRGETLTQRAIVSTEVRQSLREEVELTMQLVPRDTWKYAGFLPTLVYSHVYPERFAQLTASGQIATAKLVMTYPSLALMWQEQIESMSKKDLVVV